MDKINLVTLFKNVVLLSIMGTLPAVGILFFKGIFREKLSAKLQYYIWFLLILRLIIPTTFVSPIQFFSIEKISERTVADKHTQDLPDRKGNVPMDTKEGNPHSFSVPLPDLNSGGQNVVIKYFSRLWLTVMIGIYAYVILVNTVFAFRMRQCTPCKQSDIYTIVNQCKSKLHLTGKITILCGSRLKTPLVWGIFHPKIILPGKILWDIPYDELNYVLLHELAHIKRRDLLVHFIIMILQGIYWFNPVIWYSLRKMKEDCELSCDASVLATLEEEEYKKYGLTILSIIKRVHNSQPLPGAVGFAVKQNKRRIIMITQYKKTSTKLSVLTVLCLILLTGCSGLSNSKTDTFTNSPSENTEDSSGENIIIGDGQAAEDPLSPVDAAKQNGTDSSESAPNDAAAERSADAKAVSFKSYLDLLGLTKDELLNSMDEETESVDGGGMEFKKSGLRVWFDWDTNTVSQVYIASSDTDFNGAIIGDNIENFKKAFGDPVSDQNGDIHFRYKDAYISVNYDMQTKISCAVYLLSEDF
ncbi:M56 family metallopeptidase [Lacrimispora sp.]|uniref:M56 family metallopeptidase n=1 Tax=Lacrimispora sp. TaxID=2719234 RepID=UPI0028A038F9|nr:M56 family metallopeptidase [Lacrimispora sp.]